MEPVDQHPPVDAHQDLLHQTLRLRFEIIQ